VTAEDIQNIKKQLDKKCDIETVQTICMFNSQPICLSKYKIFEDLHDCIVKENSIDRDLKEYIVSSVKRNMSTYLQKYKDEIEVVKADIYEKLGTKIDQHKFIELNSSVSKKMDSEKAYVILSKVKADVADLINCQAREFKNTKKEFEQDLKFSQLKQENSLSSRKSRESNASFLKVLDSIWEELKRLQLQRDKDVCTTSKDVLTSMSAKPHLTSSTPLIPDADRQEMQHSAQKLEMSPTTAKIE